MISNARTSQRTRSSYLLLRAAVCAVLAGATPALAQQRAGTPIINVAVADAVIDSGPARIASNAATLRIDELLGITLLASANAIAVEGAGFAAPFVVTNAGNGVERFVLAATLEGAAGTVVGFAIDGNGNGVFDAGETVLGTALTPALAPGEAIRLLAVLAPLQSVLANAALSIFSRAQTGSGAPGTTYPGRGDGGTDAVVGPTTAEATIRFALARGAAPEATLVKSQTLESTGATTGMRGSIITYSLAANFNGGGTARGASVVDPIPAGTTFVPGSLTLDGAALSDASDGDAGSFDGTRIAVTLGDIATPQTRTIQFKVTIQ